MTESVCVIVQLLSFDPSIVLRVSSQVQRWSFQKNVFKLADNFHNGKVWWHSPQCSVLWILKNEFTLIPNERKKNNFNRKRLNIDKNIFRDLTRLLWHFLNDLVLRLISNYNINIFNFNILIRILEFFKCTIILIFHKF